MPNNEELKKYNYTTETISEPLYKVWVWRIQAEKMVAAENVTKQEAHEIRLALYHNPTTLKVAIELM